MTMQDDANNGFTERELLLDDHEPKRRKLPRFLRIALILILVLILVVLLTSFILDYRGSSELKIAYANMKAAGIPTDYSDPFYRKWDTARPTSPAENAAVSYEEAFRLLEPKLKSTVAERIPYLGRVELPDDPRDPLPPEMVSAMRDFVWMNAATLDLLHEGAGAPECYFTVELCGPGTILSHLPKARNSARLLATKILLDAEDDNSSEAIESIRDGLALHAALGREPMLISGLVSCAIGNITVSAATRLMVRASNLSNDELSVLQQAFSSSAESLSLRTGYVGEVAMQQDAYDRILRGDISALGVFVGAGGASPAVRTAWVKSIAWLIRGPIKSDRAACMETMLRIVAAAGNPTPSNVTHSYWAGQIPGPTVFPPTFRSIFLPSLSKGTQQGESLRAKLRAAAACCAAARYHSDNGKWPDSLDALIPRYLDKLPVDPFTGAELLYRVDVDGMMIYSIGPNRRDEVGRPGLLIRPKNIYTQIWDSYDDAGFRIWEKASDADSPQGGSK